MNEHSGTDSPGVTATDAADGGAMSALMSRESLQSEYERRGFIQKEVVTGTGVDCFFHESERRVLKISSDAGGCEFARYALAHPNVRFPRVYKITELYPAPAFTGERLAIEMELLQEQTPAERSISHAWCEAFKAHVADTEDKSMAQDECGLLQVALVLHEVSQDKELGWDLQSKNILVREQDRIRSFVILDPWIDNQTRPYKSPYA